MQSIKVERNALITRIQQNREQHRILFVAAEEAFRARVIEELEEMLRDARAGGELWTHVDLVPPSNHTEEYDAVLDMLQMSVEDVIVLNETEYRQLVLNKWAWFSSVTAINTTYASGGKFKSTSSSQF